MREGTKRSNVVSPPHFDATSLYPRDKLLTRVQTSSPSSGKAAAHEPSGGSSASAWPSGRADADRGGSRSRCGSVRCATDGLLLPRDTKSNDPVGCRARGAPCAPPRAAAALSWR